MITCQNCKVEFVIEAADSVFYEKLGVPSPTFCAKCRMIRRMMWRNERTLYRRECNLCNRNIVSIYSPQSPYVVYCNECFHGDRWDPISYGVEVDFTKPFFKQFQELQFKVPRLYSFVFNNTNSEYVNGAAFNKNCYLVFVSDYNEDCSYSYGLMRSKNTFDCFNCSECELCYECINCTKCYQASFSEDCSDCQNIAFSKNLANCQDCVGCVNLRNKKYHIFNEPYSKEEYLEKLKELKLNTREGIQAAQEKLAEISPRYISKYIHGLQNKDVSGDYISNSKASQECYDADSLEDCKHINHGDHAKNCQDAYVIVENSQYSYEVVSAIALNNVKAGYCVWNGFDISYSDTCENCNNLFGCVGLRKKQYCILNKQYSKEEYEALLPKIIQHLKDVPYSGLQGKIYGFGEFFPAELCPFAYNETVAQDIFPLSKSEAEGKGYRWLESEARDYKVTLESASIPKTIAETDESILKEVIACKHGGSCNDGCASAFRIAPSELQFYQRTHLPLPLLCPNCRHHRRLKQKNPPILWSRNCQCKGQTSENAMYQNNSSHFHENDTCPNVFETSYSPKRKDILYCEQCYQAEIA